MNKYIVILLAALSITACDIGESKIVGKWTSESSMGKYFGSKGKSKTITEFTAKEIIKQGSHSPIEIEADGDNVIVYQKIFGQRIGNTYKFIDKDTMILERLDNTITYHRVIE